MNAKPPGGCRSPKLNLALFVLACLALLGPPCMQSADFSDLLSGKTHPLAIKLGECNSDWRRFTIHSSAGANGNISVSVNGGNSGTSGSSQNNIADFTGKRHYLTRGQTLSAAGQDYLVAYQLPGSGLELPVLVQALVTKAPPTLPVFTAETTLSLSLLEVKSLGSLEDIRAFDLKGEIATSEKLAQTVEAMLRSASGSATNNASGAAPAKKGK